MAAAVALALMPIHHDGVSSGNAISPTYKDFGWVSYAPPPQNATIGELRAMGVEIPVYVDSSRQAVKERRWTAGILAGVGILLIAGGLCVRRGHS
jgi:hypothetical protein